MKYFKTFAILLFSFAISLYSCNDNSKTQKQETLKVVDPPSQQNAPTRKPENVESAKNVRGVWHYTCIKGCAGGAGSAVACNNCGNLLVHNSAYHTNSNSTPTSSAPFAIPPTSAKSSASKSGQNTAGEWHYKCGNGCSGGSGSSGICTTCGGALTHNTAYHQ